MDLKGIQEEVALWNKKNFPDAQPYQPLLGLAEEVGELSHAHLKMEQGIRVAENHFMKKYDAIGDIIIYLAAYCYKNDIDLNAAFWYAWDQVKDRDWIKYPENGIDK